MGTKFQAPETLPKLKTNEHTRGRLTYKTQNLNAFVKRRGTWARYFEHPKRSLDTSFTLCVENITTTPCKIPRAYP